MKHKRSSSRFLALMICLTMILSPLAVYAAEAEAADQQNAAQITESVEADNAQSLTDSEEASIDDAVIDEDADGDIAAEPESYEDEGGEEADPQGGEDAAPADAEDAEDIDVIDDTNAGEEAGPADTADTADEIIDPTQDDPAEAPADDPNEIIDDIVEVPSVEIPALADVYDATSPTMVWVESLDPTKIPMPIFGFKQSNEDIYQLYLPGGMNLSEAVLCWDGGSQVTINGENYLSGSCPLPPVSTGYNSNVVTYNFNNGRRNLASFKLVTYQGSPNVKKFFIDIDGGQEEINKMDSDKEYVTTGTIYVDGVEYSLDKMKGRGNVSWDQSVDKKPYNITLGKKIDLGLNTPATKKWSLVAETKDHSLMCNRVGLTLGSSLGIAYPATSVDIWMNGEYQGCYTVTPKTDSYVEDYGYLLEEDNYKEDDYWQFTLDGIKEDLVSGWTSGYNRFTVKQLGKKLATEDNAEEEAAAVGLIHDWMQEAWDTIRFTKPNYTDYIDVESFARVYLVEEFARNYDICAGSLFFHRDGNNDFDDKLKGGPLWDLDNAFGSTNTTFRGGVDLKTAKGDYVQSVNGYKTSIYQTFYNNHESFRKEVTRQYNLNRSKFTELAGMVDEIKAEIDASARMNHFKVVSLVDGKNNHYYPNGATLERGDRYEQVYLPTNNSRSDWDNYVANLRKFISVRSLWFEDHYYDPNVCVDHDFDETTIAPTCTEDGKIVRTCKKCDYTETETIPKLGHAPDEEQGSCTNCGEKIPLATFKCIDGLTVTVLYGKDFSGEVVENAKTAYPRENKNGTIDMTGDGQVNFVVVPAEGYTLLGTPSVTAEPKTSYKNLKGEDETGIVNGWRATKITDDFMVTVSGDLMAKVTFVADDDPEYSLAMDYNIGENAAPPDDYPSEGDYLFDGWYLYDLETDTLADEAFDFDTPITKPITLMAKHKEKGAVIKSANVDFDGQIHLVFTFEFPDKITESPDDYYVSMTKYGKEVTTKETKVSDGASNGTVFTLPVMIPEFADTVKITVCDADGNNFPLYSSKGTDYTEGFEYSVKTYAERKAADESASQAMRDLAEALFDYGTAAQIHFQYGNYTGLSVDSHVTSVTLSDIEPDKASVVSNTKPAGFTGASIMTFFESDNTLRILFSLESGRSPSDYTFTITDDLSQETQTVTPVKRIIDEKTYYCVDVKNIAAPNLDKPYVFSISDGTDTYSVRACAMSYAYTSVKNGTESRQNLGKAFYLYNNKADKFFSN